MPKLEAIADHPEANHFARLLVALLERGEAMTLPEVAARIEAAGIADRTSALRSLKRCRPGRPPVYREGEHYHLDPHDTELDLWVFRLGLRPPKVAPERPAAPEPEPLPGPMVPLTPKELDEAFTNRGLSALSAQRLVAAILDAHGEPLSPEEVVAALSRRTRYHGLRVDSAQRLRRKGSLITVREDGRWSIAPGNADAMARVRIKVREFVAIARRNPPRTSPEDLEKARARWAAERAVHGAELAAMSRALLVAFPAHDPIRSEPQAAALLDVGAHTIRTFIGAELEQLPPLVEGYDILGAMGIRPLLRALGVDATGRRLADLDPPQKTKRLNKRGRTLTITTELLIRGSCNISQPFGDPAKMARYLTEGRHTQLRRRLEADLKSLHAMYQYGRLHGALRLRWGFLDEPLPVPWVHRDEPMLYDLKREALTTARSLEVVVGSAPGWADPWSRVQRVHVEEDPHGWQSWLVDDHGREIAEAEVQLARLGA